MCYGKRIYNVQNIFKLYILRIKLRKTPHFEYSDMLMLTIYPADHSSALSLHYS